MAALLLAAAIAGCATTPSAPTGPPAPATAVEAVPPVPTLRLEALTFAAVPAWAAADLAPALRAFQRSCATWRSREDTSPLAASAPYAGTVADWRGACAAADGAEPRQARTVFETHFAPHQVVSEGGQAKLTGYFEPVIAASRSPTAAHREPILRRPDDMVSIDLAAFAEALDNAALRGGPRRLTGQQVGDQVRPYPPRGAITPGPGQAFAYAHPSDVYNLQVQGSGRLRFGDGSEVRAAYAAQNGYRWRSAPAALAQAGRLPPGEGLWDRFRRYLDSATPQDARAALALDPSYVFFAEEPLTVTGDGPRGASGVALTALGSVAVDPAFHPYGVPLFIQATHNGAPFAQLLIAQDTGGAIRRGPLRGDVFFGTGAAAGASAETMNHDNPAFVVLLPVGVGAGANPTAAP
jgi:membrane-bound lytic murein transglycosylase A